MFPRGRKLLLGVAGGISAYKSCDLLRRLQDEGFIVDVVPTQASLNFVGKATWEALSGRKVITDLWSEVENVPHISMAKENNIIVIAPTTADLLAKLASGRADDLLTNIVLASTAPKILVPAMHPEMWSNAATIQNVKILQDRGFTVITPGEGRMTGSDFGVGRYPETSNIIAEVNKHLPQLADLLGRKILITAGGTREPIDPIRFIGNRSSGKQGFALAVAAASRGAQVHLVTANTDLPNVEGITTTLVETAEQMSAVLELEFPHSDALIMSAAVADAKVASYSEAKIRKESLDRVDLAKNPDILKLLSANKKLNQVIIGFAAETSEDLVMLEESGRTKLASKSLDLIYVNNVSNGAVFGSDFTQGLIIDRSMNVIKVPEISKDTLSDILLDQLVSKLG
ncbi:phosphopantothenoylcysteine decarboxylase / phosphopantothenate--cysteine ligase [Candidatus Nanopelagicus abundans]|uniref:Coenzyme A biosynthesis bifunctional protein CoaBC n=1 Tax=Candidatus Nanopelagicus abundans TaxID=1884916 RepID=A0A249L4K0_9ACTN|nr:bifunctional phosphopantothenoylcysteine decarboxylase/phosphopantothenate--cysteine ligase CoaBC [Candidatus Nanopelagicus abundans]ASY23855.1 phosphopantothenoylcysteine decarboxylase / phosphopantothenate--cysteine ligase [Candidatus Nanopelagicus abundans]